MPFFAAVKQIHKDGGKEVKTVGSLSCQIYFNDICTGVYGVYGNVHL